MDTNLPDALVDQQGLFDPVESGPPVTLAERFVIPPFSVLDTRSGDWNRRRRQWLGLGIRSEVGRGEALTYNMSIDAYTGSTTSVFDPVLCELAYRWFSAPGDRVLDPFAGGSVRGIVASTLARDYVGVELRRDQVAANREQSHLGSSITPIWIEGDATQVEALLPDYEADLVFTCPPYADLEVYSDDPRDLSNMHYDDFLSAYGSALAASASLLRGDRFFVIVISDVRDRYGNYRGLVADTIKSAQSAGLALYNDAVVLDPVGSARLRAGLHFKYRKLTRLHQHFLVFVKGDARAASVRLSGEVSQ